MQKNYFFRKDIFPTSEEGDVENKFYFLKSRPELVQFASDYLAFQYQKQLEQWKAEAMDVPEELKELENQSEVEIPKLKNILEKIFRTGLFLFKRVKITPNGIILKIAFKIAGIKYSPKNSFPSNVNYIVSEDYVKITVYDD